MMQSNPKKITAALVGVIEYLMAEEERTRKEEEASPKSSSMPSAQTTQPSGSLWAASGRMEIMNSRRLAQMRIFRWGR